MTMREHQALLQVRMIRACGNILCWLDFSVGTKDCADFRNPVSPRFAQSALETTFNQGIESVL